MKHWKPFSFWYETINDEEAHNLYGKQQHAIFHEVSKPSQIGYLPRKFYYKEHQVVISRKK